MYQEGIDLKKIKTYIIYAGDTTDRELKEVLRLIFNSDYENLQAIVIISARDFENTLWKRKKQIWKNYKIVYDYRTGAEGISLYNVEQVHIMEPYWQPIAYRPSYWKSITYGFS